jgi:nitrogen-specific signal transduction histidine kinase
VPDIWADHNHLQEVLLHVIQNAQHAMVEAHGGGVLTIKTTMVECGVRIEVGRRRTRYPSRASAEDLQSVLHHQAAG